MNCKRKLCIGEVTRGEGEFGKCNECGTIYRFDESDYYYARNESEITKDNVEAIILQEIGDKDFTRDNIASRYAFCIASCGEADFEKINRTIVDRWSKSALEYIKKKAWKIVEGR